MMKVTIYIEKDEFDNFFKWVNRLNQGILSNSPVKYSTTDQNFDSPLQLSLEPPLYHLIKDAEKDIKTLQEVYGEMDLTFKPMSRSWELRAVQDVVRNSQRYDMEANVIYTALLTIAAMPELTPSEAMIIAEREWITGEIKKSSADI
jgi:hypothetical protein